MDAGRECKENGRFATVIPRNGLVQGMPQLFYLVDPRAVYRLEQQHKLQVLAQPLLCFFALMDNVVVHCAFRDDPASDFGMSRPPISVSSGQ